MIKDYDALIAHLKRTGRMKLLPQVLHELKVEAKREEKLAPRRETAQGHHALISGWREMKDGQLTDNTAKGALIEIYRRITN
jgi:hypothetical protein